MNNYEPTAAAARRYLLDLTPDRRAAAERFSAEIDAELSGEQFQADETGAWVDLIRGTDIKPEAVRWLWNGWLAAGKAQILGGQPGVGKSTLAMALAATLSTGGRWPDGTRSPVGSVVVWSGEDDPADTLVPRLLAMDADMRRIFFVADVLDNDGRRSFDPARDMEPLRCKLAEIGDVRLLIVDPIVSAIAGDSHKNAETRRGLQPLADLAASTRCAIIGITHFSKGTQGREPVDRIAGSLAFAALARVVMVAATEQKSDENPTPRRLLMRAKSNIGPDDGGFAYELRQDALPAHPGVVASSVSWGEAVNGSAREILAAAEAIPEGDDGAQVAAEKWLTDFLSKGPQPQRELKAAADAHCHAWSTVRRAKDRLGVRTRKVGGLNGRDGAAWCWHLPGGQDAQKTQGAQHCEMGTLASNEHLGDGGVEI